MTTIPAGQARDAAAMPLPTTPLPADQVRAGHPTTGYADLHEAGGVTIGVWEHTPGTSTDVEEDEVFVVIGGAGLLEFTEPALPPVELAPGVVVRLTAGMRTVWTIRETLRKIYVA